MSINRSDNYTRHEKLCKGKTPSLECPKCSKRGFRNTRFLNRHVNKCGASKSKYKCDNWSVEYPLKANLVQHEKICLPPTLYKCSNCLQTFKKLGNLQNHVDNCMIEVNDNSTNNSSQNSMLQICCLENIRVPIESFTYFDGSDLVHAMELYLSLFTDLDTSLLPPQCIPSTSTVHNVSPDNVETHIKN